MRVPHLYSSTLSQEVTLRAERTPGAVAVSLYGAEGPGGSPGPFPISAPVVEQTHGPWPGFPSLVVTGHNSTECLENSKKYYSVIPASQEPDNSQEQDICPAAGWLLGECCHGTVRWIKLSCKRRVCPVCGEHRKHRIAWRIELGIEQLGQGAGGALFVGTFGHDIDKPEAVRVVGKFIRWLRKRLALHIEYASTWELQANGRLHVNLVIAPWSYIRQSELSDMWHRFGGGIRVWVERVGPGIGHEAAKDRRRIGNYVAKWDQMVKEGRGVTYSRGWPKLPDNPHLERQGEISWHWVGCLESEDTLFNYERKLGHWVEVGPGEYASVHGEECDCFKHKGADLHDCVFEAKRLTGSL